MRGTLDSAPTARPLAGLLPGVYAGDEVTGELCAALDVVLAPLVLTLDNLPAYLDPDTVPADMLDWLAAWVAVAPAAASGAGVAQQRRRVRTASLLHGIRGTVDGLRAALVLALGDEVDVSIQEGGGTGWSTTPGTPMPGSGSPVLVVGLPAGTGEGERDRADQVVALVKPAHVRHRVEVERQ